MFVSRGALTVRYDTAEDLFAKLYGIAELAAVDFERMRQTVERAWSRRRFQQDGNDGFRGVGVYCNTAV